MFCLDILTEMQPAIEQDQRLANTPGLYTFQTVLYHGPKWPHLVQSTLVWILWIMIWVVVVKFKNLRTSLNWSQLSFSKDRNPIKTIGSFSKDWSPIKTIGSPLHIDIRFMYNTHQYTKS